MLRIATTSEACSCLCPRPSLKVAQVRVVAAEPVFPVAARAVADVRSVEVPPGCEAPNGSVQAAAPDDSYPDDCSAVAGSVRAASPQVDYSVRVGSVRADSAAQTVDGHCESEVRKAGSAARCSALDGCCLVPADCSAQADSAGCWAPHCSARAGCWAVQKVAGQCGKAAQTGDSAAHCWVPAGCYLVPVGCSAQADSVRAGWGQVDSAAAGSALDDYSVLAAHPDARLRRAEFPADSRAGLDDWVRELESLAVPGEPLSHAAERSSLPEAPVFASPAAVPAVQDAAPALVVLPKTTAVAAVAQLWQSRFDLLSLAEARPHGSPCWRADPTPLREPAARQRGRSPAPTQSAADSLPLRIAPPAGHSRTYVAAPL